MHKKVRKQEYSYSSLVDNNRVRLLRIGLKIAPSSEDMSDTVGFRSNAELSSLLAASIGFLVIKSVKRSCFFFVVFRVACLIFGTQQHKI